MKKYLAELVGTMVLVLTGCGTAVSIGCGTPAINVVVAKRMISLSNKTRCLLW